VVVHEDVDGEVSVHPDELAGFRTPIRLLHSSTHLGMAANWDAAVRASTGAAVIVPGQDDLLKPAAVSMHLDLLGRSGVAVSSSAVDYIDDAGRRVRNPARSVAPSRIFSPARAYVIPYRELVQLAVSYGNVTGEPSGTMFLRAAYDEAGGYDSTFQHSADLDMTLRLAKLGGGVAYSAASLSARRIHAGNATHEHVRRGIAAADRALIYERCLPDLPDEYARSRGQARLASHVLYDWLRNHPPGGLRALRRSLSLSSVSALAAEVLENLSIKRPVGRKWVATWQL
jgi:hypothetical protein